MPCFDPGETELVLLVFQRLHNNNLTFPHDCAILGTIYQYSLLNREKELTNGDKGEEEA